MAAVATPTERIVVGVFVLLLAFRIGAGVLLNRSGRAAPPRPPRLWAQGVWYASGVLLVLLWGWGAVHWRAWTPSWIARGGDLGAFPLAFAVTVGIGYLSSRQFLSRSGEPRSMLPLPLQGVMVGLMLGSALTIEVRSSPPALVWFALVFLLFIGRLYRDFFEWLWTRAAQPSSAAAAKTLLSLWHRPRRS